MKIGSQSCCQKTGIIRDHENRDMKHDLICRRAGDRVAVSWGRENSLVSSERDFFFFLLFLLHAVASISLSGTHLAAFPGCSHEYLCASEMYICI